MRCRRARWARAWAGTARVAIQTNMPLMARAECRSQRGVEERTAVEGRTETARCGVRGGPLARRRSEFNAELTSTCSEESDIGFPFPALGRRHTRVPLGRRSVPVRDGLMNPQDFAILSGIACGLTETTCLLRDVRPPVVPLVLPCSGQRTGENGRLFCVRAGVRAPDTKWFSY